MPTSPVWWTTLSTVWVSDMSKLATTYAQALYSLAAEENLQQEMLEQLLQRIQVRAAQAVAED